MKFTCTDKKIKIPDTVHDYAKKKFGKLDRYFKGDCEVALTFSIEREQNRVEATARSEGMIFRVSESTSDMYASVDAAVATMERQIRKNKTRLAKRLRRDAFDTAEESGSFVPEEPEEGEFRIVRKKMFSFKPMNREEAILQMNLLEHTFFAFLDEDNDDHFAVVYVRKNGGYGLIEDDDGE